jgi:hypothetical protein
MDTYNKALIDLSHQDAGVVEQFTTLHPDLEAWAKSRADGLTSLSTVSVIKYVVSCYDKESPLVNSYKRRWAVKKRESALVAGFAQNENGHFSEEADQVIFCHNNVTNKLILRYLYLQHDRLYQTYVIYNEMYLNQSAELMRYEFAQPAHAKAAKENLDILGKDIEELEFKIFSGEETKKMKDMLYEEATNIFNDLRPEKIAMRLEEGKPAVDYNPYGNYKPKKMQFMGDE